MNGAAERKEMETELVKRNEGQSQSESAAAEEKENIAESVKEKDKDKASSSGLSSSSSSSSSPAPSSISISPKLFFSRAHSLFESWKSGSTPASIGKGWGIGQPPFNLNSASAAAAAAASLASSKAMDLLLLVTGSSDRVEGSNSSEETYSKLLALQYWLFGYEIPDSIAIFSQSSAGIDTINIIASKKKCHAFFTAQNFHLTLNLMPQFPCPSSYSLQLYCVLVSG